MGLYDIRFEGLSKTSSDFLKSVLNVFLGKYYVLRNPIWRFGGLYYMSELSECPVRPAAERQADHINYFLSSEA